MTLQTPPQPKKSLKDTSKKAKEKAKNSSKKALDTLKNKDELLATPAVKNAKDAIKGARGNIRSYLPNMQNTTASYTMIRLSTYCLVIIGLVMVLSASSVENIKQGSSSWGVAGRQALWAIGGLAIMEYISRKVTKEQFRKRWVVKLFGAGTILLLLAVQFTPLGKEVNGNRNWFQIGSFSGQPSEIAKFWLCIFLPYTLAIKKKYLSDIGVVLNRVWPAIIPVILVWMGHDMGTTLVLVGIIAGALFIAGIPSKYFTLMSLAGAVAVFGMTMFQGGNRRARFAAFLGDCNTDDLSGMCWQSQSGKYGLATGHWFGVGLGSSREKWSWLPEAHNDYIFAIIGEELGFFGTFLVVALFCVLLLGLSRIVSRHRDPYIRIATGCVMFWIMTQALINMCMVSGLLPVIGVPLPLISYGGTSLLFTLMAIGMVLSFARTEPRAGDQDNITSMSYKGIAKAKPIQKTPRKRRLSGQPQAQPQENLAPAVTTPPAPTPTQASAPSKPANYEADVVSRTQDILKTQRAELEAKAAAQVAQQQAASTQAAAEVASKPMPRPPRRRS